MSIRVSILRCESRLSCDSNARALGRLAAPMVPSLQLSGSGCALSDSVASPQAFRTSGGATLRGWWPALRSRPSISLRASRARLRLHAARIGCDREQLFMQQLEGTVELELSLRPFSPVGELRGLLSPIVEEPRTPGPVRHRAFTLLEPAKVSKSTYNRHRRAAEQQPPPVAMMRYVSLLRPMHLSALFASQAQEMRLYCRKSRAQTEYFAELPAGWGGWTASSY